MSILTADECARADRFRFAPDRNPFLNCRIALREILATLQRIPAGEIRFDYGPKGKPALTGAGTPLEFSVSHRADLAVIAVTEGRRVGVDVERVGPVEDAEKLAARFFSADEQASLRAVRAEDRDEAFFACWTRKEAFVKALGEGLSMPLDSFSVSLVPDAPPALLAWTGREDERSAWSLRSWRPGPGYLAAIAVEGPDAGSLLREERWP